jgi:DNA-binding response OmpR family regulator
MNKPWVVIVEDDSSLGKIFATAFEIIGFNTEVVADGEIAFERIAARMPDLVTLDMQIPHVSGVEILRQLRADTRFQEIKIIMVTANDRAAEIESVDTLADVILIKPITFSQIREFASRLVQQPK